MKRNVLSSRTAIHLFLFVFAGSFLARAAEVSRVGRWEQRQTPFLAPRWLHTAVWNGNEMLVWGGGASAGFFNDGARYNPAADQWTGFSAAGAPSRRWAHAAAWTGSEMLIWGGSASFYHTGTIVGDGGRYAPGSDTWRPMSAVGAPSGRCGVCAVWTGSEFVIWGGRANDGSTPATGARYNPATDTWRSISTLGAPGGRFYGTAVWTGKEMIVWGGQDSALGVVGTGGRYDPSTDTWAPVELAGAPSRRFIHVAVWTGTEMIVSGGTVDAFNPINGGGIYNPSSRTWRQLETAGAPSARHFASAVWSGSEMIVWGGGNPYYNDGARFDPARNQWTRLPTTTAAPRAGQSALWVGSMMLIFGGASGTDFNDTYAYFVDPDASGPNTAPSISLPPGVGDQAIPENGEAGPIGFVVHDQETPAERLIVRGRSSNQTLVPDGSILFEGSGPGRSVRVKPLPNRFGSVRITLVVTDGGGLTAETSFNLVVQSSNDPPTISIIADQTVVVDAPLGPLAFVIGDDETPAGQLTVTVISLNQELLPLGGVVLGGGGANRTLTVTPSPGRTGTGVIELTVSDGTLSSSRRFSVTVNLHYPRQVRVVPATGTPGATVEVPIELVAFGNENAIGLSLAFPAESLVYVGARVGSNAPSATLNASFTSQSPLGGAVGLGLALPSGQTFPAGTQQVMMVSFRIAPNGPGLKPIVPMNFPVLMEVAGADAVALPASFLGNEVKIVVKEYEADVSPRPNGNLDGSVTVADWVQVGRFVVGLDTPSQGVGGEFRRVDCAPRAANGKLTLGDGVLSIADWVQAGRYAAGLDPATEVGGPAAPVGKAGIGSGVETLGKASLSARVLRLVPGTNGVLAVELAGQGDEAGLGFSLGFDSTAWRFANASLTGQSQEMTLQVNATLAAGGKVGFALAKRDGGTLMAGTSTIMLVQFEPRSAKGGQVVFSDEPVRSEVVNSSAEPLNITCEMADGGLFAGPGASPTVSIRHIGSRIVLNFNGPQGGWIVEESGDLSAGGWRAVAVETTPTGDTRELRIEPAGAARFFRLRAP